MTKSEIDLLSDRADQLIVATRVLQTRADGSHPDSFALLSLIAAARKLALSMKDDADDCGDTAESDLARQCLMHLKVAAGCAPIGKEIK